MTFHETGALAILYSSFGSANPTPTVINRVWGLTSSSLVAALCTVHRYQWWNMSRDRTVIKHQLLGDIAYKQFRLLLRQVFCPSDRDVNVSWSHRPIGWKSSKITSYLVSLVCSLSADQTSRIYSKGNNLKFWPKVIYPCWFERRRHSISNCDQTVKNSELITMLSV